MESNIRLNEQKADIAYAAYCALRKAERGDPTLRDNPLFQTLMEDCLFEFRMSFELIK